MKTITAITCLGSVALLCSCGPKEAASEADAAATPPTTNPSVQPAAPPKPAPARTASDEEQSYVYVQMETSLGDILLKLDRTRAPISVANFLSYADRGFYDGTIFHRVIRGFMIHGGGFTPDLKKKPTGPPIANESQNGLKNARGTIAMARRNDPDSATSQFFINVVDTPDLDKPISGGPGYAVFGEVIEGMGVVDAIRVVPTGQKGGHRNAPIREVVIERVRAISPQDAEGLVEGS